MASQPGAGRRYAGVLVALLVGSLGVLLSYGATWAVVEVPVFSGAPETPGREVALTGRALAPLGAAMGWVGLAAIAALLATRTWGRRVTGVIVLLAGGVAGVAALAFALSDMASGGVNAFIEAALGTPVEASAAVALTAWWLPASACGLVLVACGLLALLAGPSWPRLGARYSRPQEGGAPSAAATWDALDRGEDPTEDPTEDGATGERRDPHGTPGSIGHSGPDPGAEEER